MSDITSSGKKLYSILKEAWNEDGKKHIVNVWVKVLGADASNVADISIKLGQLIVLLDEVRDDIKDLEISNIQKFVNALNKIQIFLLTNQILSVEWGTIKGQITEETLDLIDACGDLLAAQTKGFRELSPIELEELQQEIRNLQDEIRDSDIEKETKIFLINELRKIEELILNYRIRGSSGLAKVSKEVSGGILIKWFQMSEKAKEVAGKVINVAIKTNSMINVAERLSKLPEGLKDILPLLLPGNGR
jgi:gas vesicle protein